MRPFDREWAFVNPWDDPPDLTPIVDAYYFMLCRLSFAPEIDARWLAVADVLDPDEFAEREARRQGIARQRHANFATGSESLLTAGYLLVQWECGPPNQISDDADSLLEEELELDRTTMALLAFRRGDRVSSFRAFGQTDVGLMDYDGLTLRCGYRDPGYPPDPKGCGAEWRFSGWNGDRTWTSKQAPPLDSYECRLEHGAKGREGVLVIGPQDVETTPCPHCGRGELINFR